MDEREQKLDEIFAYYGGLKNTQEQENLVALLREVQETCGCIEPEMRRRAAEVMQVKETVLTCLIRRYPSLKEAPYRHVVTVCTGARCEKKESAALLAAARRALEPDAQGISRDRTVLLKTQNCLKQCRTSPNMMIDGVLYPGMTAGSAERLLEKLEGKKQDRWHD